MLDEQHPRPTGDKPAAVVNLQTLGTESLDGATDDAGGCGLFKLEGGLGGFPRADEAIALPPPLNHAGDFGPQHLKDAADLVAHFPRDFEQQTLRRFVA